MPAGCQWAGPGSRISSRHFSLPSLCRLICSSPSSERLDLRFCLLLGVPVYIGLPIFILERRIEFIYRDEHLPREKTINPAAFTKSTWPDILLRIAADSGGQKMRGMIF